jgi:DNA (cytosine-5)-methyltransferase 1
MGYSRAGFEVVGVDIKPQPHYPFEFAQDDVFTWWDYWKLAEIQDRYDAIHASPPCQAYSAMRNMWPDRVHPDLIRPTRDLLDGIALPYVIENVPGAPMRPDLILCGSHFGLRVRRHRWFEANGWLSPFAITCRHDENFITVTGTGAANFTRRTPGGGPHRKPQGVADARNAMGVDWMTRAELSQAIPPAYTEWIGRQLMAHLERAA